MTITPEQQKMLLERLGYPSNRYSVDRSGIISRSLISPTPKPRELTGIEAAMRLRQQMNQLNADGTPKVAGTVDQDPSNLESFGRAGASSILPGIAGLAASLAIPGGLVATIGRGLLASLLTGGAQEGVRRSFETDEETALRQQQLTVDREVNPLATLAGEFLPTFITMNPIASAGATGNAIKGIGRLASSGRALNAAQKTALVNAGVSSGIEVGIEGAFQAIEGDFNATRLAGAAGLGLLGTRPNALGRRVGIADPINEQLSEALRLTTSNTQDASAARPKVSQKDASEQTQPSTTQEDSRNKVEVIDFDKATETPAPATKVTPYSRRGFGKANPETVSWGKEQGEFGVAEQLALDANLTGITKSNLDPVVSNELNSPAFYGPRQSKVSKADRLSMKMHESAIEINRKIVNDPQASEKLKAAAQRDIEIHQEKLSSLQKQNAAKLIDNAVISMKTPDQTQTGRVRKLVRDQGLDEVAGENPTAEQALDSVAEAVGVKPIEGDDLPPASLLLRSKIAQLDPENPNPEELLNDISHLFLQSLKESDSPLDKKLVSEGEKLFGGREALVESIGAINNPEVFKSTGPIEWLRDFWGHVRARWGNATKEDYDRLLKRRLFQEMQDVKQDELLNILDRRNSSLRHLLEADALTEPSKQKIRKTRRETVDAAKKGNVQEVRRLLKMEDVEGLSPEAAIVVAEHNKAVDNLLAPHRGLDDKSNPDEIKALLEDLSKFDAPDAAIIRDAVDALKVADVDAPISFDKQKSFYSANKGTWEGPLSFLKPALEKITNTDKKIGDAFNTYFRKATRLEGEFANKYMLELNRIGATQAEIDKVHEWRFKKYDGEDVSNIVLTDREKYINKLIIEQHDLVRAVQNAERLKIKDGDSLRAGRFNQDYHPSIISKEAIGILQDINHPAHAATKQEIAQYWAKKMDARKMLDSGDLTKADIVDGPNGPEVKMETILAKVDEFAEALKRNSNLDNATKFKALRRPQGLGLPWQFQDQNGLNAFRRYGKRAAEDISFFSVMEKDAYVRDKLALTDSEGTRNKAVNTLLGDKNVEDVINYIYKTHFGHGDLPDSLNRLVLANILGPVTTARDIFSTYANSLPYMNPMQTRFFLQALGKIKEGMQASFQAGVNRQNVLDIEFQGATGSKLQDSMNYLSNMIAIAQGRQLGEQFSRANTFVIGQLMARSDIGLALKGDKRALMNLQQFLGSSDGYNLDTILKRGTLTIAEQNEYASNFVGKVQGNYDPSELPNFTFNKSVMQPFFQLSRWAIGQTNKINDRLIRPALKGDKTAMKQLAFYIGGSVIAGEGINQIVEAMQSKPLPELTLAEQAKISDKKVKEVGATLLQSMQAAGTYGIALDSIAGIVSAARGGLGRSVNYPLMQFLNETLKENVGDALTAVSRGADPTKTLMALMLEMTRSTNQGARMIMNDMDQERMEASRAYRNERLFNLRSGRPVNEPVDGLGNKFLNPAQREYLRAKDPLEIVMKLPAAIEEVFRDSNGIEKRIVDGIKNLKSQNLQGIPSPDTDPQAFAEMMDFMQQLGGDKAVQAMLQHYEETEALRKLRKQLVGKI